MGGSRNPVSPTGGLRANTVCYAIAKLVHDLDQEGQSLDLQKIWSIQDIPDVLVDALDQYAELMHMHLLAPPTGGSNPTEWAKKKASVEAAMRQEIELRCDLTDLVVSVEETRSRSAAGKRDQRMINGIQAQTKVVEVGTVGWEDLKAWAEKTSMRLTPAEAGILEAATRIRHKPLSEAQAVRAISLLERAATSGFSPKERI